MPVTILVLVVFCHLRSKTPQILKLLSLKFKLATQHYSGLREIFLNPQWVHSKAYQIGEKLLL